MVIYQISNLHGFLFASHGIFRLQILCSFVALTSDLLTSVLVCGLRMIWAIFAFILNFMNFFSTVDGRWPVTAHIRGANWCWQAVPVPCRWNGYWKARNNVRQSLFNSTTNSGCSNFEHITLAFACSFHKLTTWYTTAIYCIFQSNSESENVSYVHVSTAEKEKVHITITVLERK